MYPNFHRLLPSTLYHKLEDKDASSTDEAPTKASNRSLWAIHVFLLVAGMFLLVMNFIIALQLPTCRGPAPVSDFWFDGFVRKDVKFIGSFEAESPFRGPPGPEVDAEWNRFTSSPWIDGTSVVLGVGDEEVAHARKDRDEEWLNSTVKLGEENGGGIMASLEMFHQLHCLDLLRKYSHFNYAYYRTTGSTFDQDLDIQKNHIDHCVDVIRQVIMCNGDTGLILFHWIERTRVPYPDFNVWHRCRDPEEVLALAKSREAPIVHRVKKAQGDVIMPMPP
ncbi:hypothetical protein F4778DRAFT_785521 [Xylariomycetidae sp. FL2044]|nr:hypothetical protein F4778DRAFT_785521 [Xylariomycetidae sp. FL2044]